MAILLDLDALPSRLSRVFVVVVIGCAYMDKKIEPRIDVQVLDQVLPTNSHSFKLYAFAVNKVYI